MPKLIDGLSKEAVDDLAEIAMQLSRNAETRKPFLNAIKKIDPNRRFPAQEIEDLREEMKANAERDKEERKLEDARKEAETRLNAQRAALVGKGYNDDQIKEVEAIMTKHGFADYEVADELYVARKPATPADAPSANWEFPTIGKNVADFVANPEKHARQEAYDTITEFRRKRA